MQTRAPVSRRELAHPDPSLHSDGSSQIYTQFSSPEDSDFNINFTDPYVASTKTAALPAEPDIGKRVDRPGV